MKLLWIAIFCGVFIWSAIAPKDYFTWLLEVAPALIGFMIVVATYSRYRLTPLAYLLILAHCIVLMVGGHYTYAEVPLFDGLGASLGFERNNYDKLGHFMQGFAPALLAREILIHKQVVSLPAWRDFFIVCFCLAFSAFYELIEWLVAVLAGQDSEAFLGTQGFVWDTQTDMAMALVGAVLALLLLPRIHDRQMKEITWN